MVGIMATGRYGTGAVAERSHLETTRQRKSWIFETSKSTPSDTTPSTGPHLLLLPKQIYHKGPSIQLSEPIRTILIQTTTGRTGTKSCVLTPGPALQLEALSTVKCSSYPWHCLQPVHMRPQPRSGMSSVNSSFQIAVQGTYTQTGSAILQSGDFA